MLLLHIMCEVDRFGAVALTRSTVVPGITD